MKIRIRFNNLEITVNLQETQTAKKLFDILPCESRAQTWGEEVYFEVPLEASLESDARQVVDPGTVCFWVEGNSIAIPFGKTPISKGGECRLVSPCNVLGQMEGRPQVLADIRDGAKIRVEKV